MMLLEQRKIFQNYPSISEAIIKNNFNIIYVKNDLYVEENIKIAVEKYQPDFLVISVIQWIDGIKIHLNFDPQKTLEIHLNFDPPKNI